MSERYLWDRSGEPDPEIEQLERTLAPLRLEKMQAVQPVRAPVPRYWRAAAAAAVIVAAVGIGRFAIPVAKDTAWQIAGSPVRQGQVLRTRGTAVQLESESV